MGRFAYAVSLLVIAGLLWFLFRPDAPVEDRVPLLSGPPPLVYRMHVGTLQQEIDHQTVALYGVKRPLNVSRADSWWGFLRQLSLPKELVVASVSEKQLGAYGMDGSRELDAAPLRIRWGVAAGKGYIWDAQSERIFVVNQKVIKQLDQLAVRFDNDQLLWTDKLAHIIVTRGKERTSVVLIGEDWVDDVHPSRPHCTRCAQTLVALCSGLRLTDFTLKAPVTEPDIGEVRLSQEQGPLGLDQVARIWSTPTGGLIQVGAMPPQPLDAAGVSTLR